MMGLFVAILFTCKKRHQSVRKVPWGPFGHGLGTFRTGTIVISRHREKAMEK